jgi:hypothetical protein
VGQCSPDLRAIGRYRAGRSHQDLSSANPATCSDRRFKQGRTGEGFDKLDKFGAIQEIPDDADRLAAIAEKQIEALKAQKFSLIIAPTHGECRAIAGALRKAMKEKGLLLDPEHVTRLQRLNLTDSQQSDGVT